MSDAADTPSDATMGAPRRAGSLAALGAILVLAAALRFPALDRVPPGLWFDEALNLEDAAAALENGLKIVYPDVFPREPMFETLLVGVMRLAGPKLEAFRALSAAIGVLTVLALYFCARSYAGERTALLAAGTLAVMRWHVIFSRLLFRTLMLPLWITLIALAAAWARQKPGSIPRAVLVGALAGGGFYTYLAWYFMLPLVAAALLWALWPRGEPAEAGAAAETSSRKSMAPLAAAMIAALAVAAPILVTYARHPDYLLSRPEAVSPFAEGAGPAVRLIGRNIVMAAGMFHVAGDEVPKQNWAGKPGLDPLQGALFLLGLGFCVSRISRREPFAAGVLLWIFCGTAPTIFTKTDSPNFLRTLVLTPALAAAAGFGASEIWKRAEAKLPDRSRGAAFFAFAALVISLSGALTARDVYLKWARSPDVWASFNGDVSQLGRAAAANPRGVSLWVPRYLSEHRSFRVLSQGNPSVMPYENFDFLRPGVGRPVRRIVVTAHNGLFPVLQELAPGGRVAEQFVAPDGRVWALAYEVDSAALPTPEAVAKAEAEHPVDIRW